MKQESFVSFSLADEELVGILHRPPVPPAPIGVLIAVGGPQYRVGSHRQFVLSARRLASAGFPVLRFDYRGMGDSEGPARTFETVDEDIRAAVDAFFACMPKLHSVVVYGLCDAASAALLYCMRDERIAGLILLNPWVRSASGQARAQIRHYYARRLLDREFWAKLSSGRINALSAAGEFMAKLATFLSFRRGGPVRESESIGDFRHGMLTAIKRFTRPILVVLSEDDLTAREFMDLCNDEREWGWAMAQTKVSVCRLANADHTFSKRSALDAADRACIDWLGSLERRTADDE
jgi:exosortase A-associated hydrolase 1